MSKFGLVDLVFRFDLVDLVQWIWPGTFGLLDLVKWIWFGRFGLIDSIWELWFNTDSYLLQKFSPTNLS